MTDDKNYEIKFFSKKPGLYFLVGNSCIKCRKVVSFDDIDSIDFIKLGDFVVFFSKIHWNPDPYMIYTFS